jgi:hypothetical protein
MTNTLNERQRHSLYSIAEHGSGVKIDKRTANALVRRGMAEITGRPVYESGGVIMRLTHDGRMEVIRQAKEKRERRILAGRDTRDEDRLIANLTRVR